MNLNTSKWTGYKRLLFMALLGTGVSLSAFADKTISGNVKDDQGQPAIGATVQVEGTTIGTMTDLDGNYTLTVPDNTTEVTISYVGLATQTVKIKGNIANADMKADDKTLDDVVVVGYQTVKKRDVVASTASVGADQIKNLPVTDAAQAMQGKLAGVQVTQSEGSPDAEVSIRVRGGNSLTQSSTPLYIVDGFPVSSINDISPTDIQSIDVLKDAAATAIYGAQGANGVIIVTTKDAQGDDSSADCGMKFNVDYTGYMGWKSLSKKYDVLDAKDFATLQYEYAYLAKKGKASDVLSNWNQYFDKNYDATNKTTTSTYKNVLDAVGEMQQTDWQDETFGRTALTSNHSFSVAAASKKATFNFSYNRIDDEGIMQESDYTRNNLSLKTKFKPFKDFTIGSSVRYTNTVVLGSGSNTADDAGSKTENRIVNAIAFTPVQLLAVDNSALEDEESFGNMYDPITTIADNYKFKRDNKFDINGYLSYKFLKKFTARVDLGYQSRTIDVDRFYGKTTYYSRGGSGFSNAGGKTGYVSGIRTNEVDTRLRQTATLNYKNRFGGAHNVDVLLGEEVIRNEGEINTDYGWGYPGTYSGEYLFDHFASYSKAGVGQEISPNDNMLSFFAKLGYDYKGRYYLNGTLRADCSTRFAEGNQWGYFPALAAAWRISDESWMRGFARSAKLSNLKLRLSYGVAGNNNVDLGATSGDYTLSTENTYLSESSFENTAYTLSAGGADKIVPNEDLKWETTTTRDLGLDYGFFNDRLSGAVDLYWNSTDDLIIKYKLATVGYQYRNVAETKNLGVEFSVKGVLLDKRSKNFNYNLTVDANISHNENEVVSLGGMDAYYVSTRYLGTGYFTTDEFIVRENRSIGEIYGFKTDGFYTANDFSGYNATNMEWLDANGNKVESSYGINGVAYPGLLKVVDLNNDGKITAEDRTVIGCTMPDFTGGFSISGSVGCDNWGLVDAAVNFTYSYGNDVLNLTNMAMSTVQEKTKLRNTLNDATQSGTRYTLFADDGTYIPSTSTVYSDIADALNKRNAGASEASPIMGNTMLTDQYVEDGSFLRLASMTIGYSLPDKWISKAKLTKARVFFTASNLFVLTGYSGSDPEVSTGTKRNPLAVGVDWSAYPRSRNFNFGVNLSF